MSELKIEVTKTINADPQTTFDAWLDPKTLASFVLPKPGMPNPEVKLEPNVGGEFEILMDVGEAVIPHHGVYQEISRPNRLVFTWNSPFSATDSVVSIEFEALGDAQTKVTLTHEKFPNQESLENHKVGWGNILDQQAVIIG